MKRWSTSYVIRKTQNNNNLAQTVKNLPAMQETWIQDLEDPLEKGDSYPLQYSGLENFMDCMVHGVTKSQTLLSDFHFGLPSGSDSKGSACNVGDLVSIPG